MGNNLMFSGFNIFHELLQRQILLFPTYQDYFCTCLTMESIAGIFPLYFHLPCLPEETCLEHAGSSPVEGNI